MMKKTSMICVLALVALANGQDAETHVQSNDETRVQECVPGTTKMVDCNTCFCDERGDAWACTLMGCGAPVAIASKGANTQLDEANPVDRVRRDAPQPETCVPGTTKKIECNNCFCVDSGLGWACTQMGCLSEVIAGPDGTAA